MLKFNIRPRGGPLFPVDIPTNIGMLFTCFYHTFYNQIRRYTGLFYGYRVRRLRCLDETLHGHQVSSYLRSIFFTAHRSSSHAVKHKTLLEDPLTRMLYCYLYSIIFLIKRKKKSNSEHSNSYAITKRGVTSSFYVVVAYYLCLDTVVIFFVNSIFCILLQRCANLWF